MAGASDKATGAVGLGCLVLVAIVGVVFLKACHDDDAMQHRAFDATNAIAIDAEALDGEFKDNEVAARSKYGNASLRLTGVIGEINGGSPATVKLNVFLASPVSALLPDEKAVIPLHVGMKVELQCVGARQSLGTTVVDSCSAVKETS